MKLGDGVRLRTPNIRELGGGHWSESRDLSAAAWAGWVGDLPQEMTGPGEGELGQPPNASRLVRGLAEELGPGLLSMGIAQQAGRARLLIPVS